jgi:penicillin-binding protein 2
MKFALLTSEEQQLFRARLALISGVVAVLLFALLFRVWFMQVVDGDLYRELAQGNRIRVVPQEAPRGIIYDRHGAILAFNRPAFNVQLVPEDAPDLDKTLRNVSLITGYPYADLLKALDENRTPYKFKPLLLLEDIGRKAADLVETYQEDLPGITVAVEPKRLYPTAYIASHVVGYVGLITRPQLRELPLSKARSGRIVGHSGIELVENRTLIGTDGGRQVEVDHIGRELRTLGESVDPVPGEDLYLSLDLELQQYIKTQMSGQSGAVVVMRARTGEILAMGSYPDFDPNLFVGRIDELTWDKMVRSENEMLINKAIQGQYPPGSTFKMLVALAGLDLGIIKPDSTFNCPGYHRVGRDIRYCWRGGGHGEINVVQAIAQSCNVFFYQLGLQVGVDQIERYARMFGFGRPTGLELDSEKAGLVPSREWKERAVRERWYHGETMHLSIGQGFLNVTPIQLLAYVNAIANRGIWVQPTLLSGSAGTSLGASSAASALAARSRMLPIPAQHFDVVREGMREVVAGARGTARRANSRLVEISGKTGTSQVVGRRARTSEDGLEEDDALQPHSLFVGYAPSTDPDISVLVLVEHGKSGGETAAPLARRIVEHYFQEVRPRENLPPRQQPELQADGATGHPFTGRLARAFPAGAAAALASRAP